MSSDARSALRRLIGVAALAAVIALAAACSTEGDFDEPSDPVANIPWPDYERAEYDMFDQTDTELGAMILEIQREDGEYRLRVRFELTATDTIDEAMLWVDAESLRPLRYQRDAAGPDGALSVRGDYGVDTDGEAFADVVVVDSDGERFEERLEIGEFAFDNETSAWLWRSLPFDQDLQRTYRSVNLRFRRSQLVQVAVRGQDVMRGPDGDVLAWQVVATPGVEVNRAWYAVDPPHHLLRWDQQPRRFILRTLTTTPPP